MSSEGEGYTLMQIFGFIGSLGGLVTAIVGLFVKQGTQAVEISNLKTNTEKGHAPHEVRIARLETVQDSQSEDIGKIQISVARTEVTTTKTAGEVTAIFDILNNREN